MSLDLARFGARRPYLFHLTARDNLYGIRAAGLIECASALFARAHDGELSTMRRDLQRMIEVDSRVVVVRDQKPLCSPAISFEEGWDLPRFVRHINEHVFFWPGSSIGPIKSGLNHYRRYAHEKPALMRVLWCSVLDTNQTTEPLFSRYNSGAPRMVNGKRSPRGAETYLDSRQFNGSASDVTEVVFPQRVVLPSDTEVSSSYSGPWEKLDIGTKMVLT